MRLRCADCRLAMMRRARLGSSCAGSSALARVWPTNSLSGLSAAGEAAEAAGGGMQGSGEGDGGQGLGVGGHGVLGRG